MADWARFVSLYCAPTGRRRAPPARPADAGDRDVLIAGNVIVATDPYVQQPGARVVCRAATADVAQNRRSLDRLAELSVTNILTGHVKPITTGIRPAVESARHNHVA